ncbi:unnamed protein product, partial [Meganyctiphanes norvegica]
VPLPTSMLPFRITCVVLVLAVTLVNIGSAESGIHPRGPRDCGDVYIAGGQLEGYYAVFPKNTAPDEADLVYCDVSDGMLPANSSGHRAHPKNCQDLSDTGMSESGINVVYPYAEHPESPVVVYCEQSLLGGGWTVFQRRDNYATQLDFYRSFDEYSLGFGNVGTEFWLGNDILNEITQQSVNELYVELTSFADVTKYANYKVFDIANKTAPTRPYQLTVSHYSGDAGDALQRHNGMGFTTFDADNDLAVEDNCAVKYKGGWWYYFGYSSNLNGIYFEEGKDDVTSANWYFISGNHESLKRIRMMTRPMKQQ